MGSDYFFKTEEVLISLLWHFPNAWVLFTLLTIVKQGLGAASVLHPAAAAEEEEDLAHFQNLPLSPACANLQLGLLVQTPSSQP